MRMPPIFARPLFMAAAVLAASEGVLAQNRDVPLEIKPAAYVDEQLFLVRALEVAYEGWPRGAVEREQVEPWLMYMRSHLSRLRAIVDDKDLDPRIGVLYDDCLALLTTHETYLANLGVIDRATQRQEQRDTGAVVQTTFKWTFGAADVAKKRGASDKESIAAGVVGGIAAGFLKAYQQGREREDAAQAALEAEARKVDAAWTTTMAKAGTIVQRLTEKYHWKQGEAGFDGFQSDAIKDHLRRRPRDPFVKVANARIRVEGETVDDLVDRARKCVEATRDVPAGHVYDGYRATFLVCAADLAVTAASRQLDKSAYSSGPAKAGPGAVRICKALLAVDQTDSGGTGHMLLARALASTRRFDEAIVAANHAIESWKTDPFFCYRYARLMSLTNRHEAAGRWLEKAYDAGFDDISFVRGDPDLAGFRQAKPSQYKELTTLRFSFDFNWGRFNDDVVVSNDSPFKLTNVRFQMFVKKGDRVWRPALDDVESLEPAEQLTFVNAISIPGGSYDQAELTLSCDQGKAVSRKP